jgi:hypothetical protein
MRTSDVPSCRTRRAVAFAVALTFVLAVEGRAQTPPAQGSTPSWLPCPRCLTDEETAAAAEKSKRVSFNPRDLSGLWGLGTNGFNLNQGSVPPMTPWAQARYDAAKPGLGRRGVPLGNDPMMICDPLGFPRSFTYNYGMDVVQTPTRMFQFFEYDHVWRTIYTDGRTLPENPDPRWYGYAVGKWEGDTFVVESLGYDDRTWLDQDGHPHSDEMRVTERYRRTGPDTMDVSLTIDDPTAYTKPWITNVTLRLNVGGEMGEQFCVPSEEATFKKLMRDPAGGAK